MKLLVVEDERRMLELLRQGLSEEGHTVSCAVDGSEGLQMVRDHDFDVVILDVMMPKIDGFELARRMRTENNVTPRRRRRRHPVAQASTHQGHGGLCRRSTAPCCPLC